jgi:hypothetical protein
MALSVRRSILMNSLLKPCFFLATLAVVPVLAQRPGRVTGAVPVSPPPMVHAPVYHPPVYQPPVYRTPSYAPVYAPRIPSLSPVRPLAALPSWLPSRPIRPAPPIIRIYIFPLVAGPFWPSYFCWWATCDQFWASAFIYNPSPFVSWNPVNYLPPAPEPVYVYGAEPRELPELFLNDGTALNVTDYWLIDGQLHFLTSEEEGTKPTEQVIPFDALDLQKTIDVNTRRGFRFMLRNEPFEQYVRDHPEGPPQDLSLPPQR